MQFEGITIKGLSELESERVIRKINTDAINTLISQVPNISIHPHFYILFEYGCAHIDYNRRAVIVEYRVSELGDDEASVNAVNALNERLMAGIEGILANNAVNCSVVVRAI